MKNCFFLNYCSAPLLTLPCTTTERLLLLLTSSRPAKISTWPKKGKKASKIAFLNFEKYFLDLKMPCFELEKSLNPTDLLDLLTIFETDRRDRSLPIPPLLEEPTLLHQINQVLCWLLIALAQTTLALSCKILNY